MEKKRTRGKKTRRVMKGGGPNKTSNKTPYTTPDDSLITENSVAGLELYLGIICKNSGIYYKNNDNLILVMNILSKIITAKHGKEEAKHYFNGNFIDNEREFANYIKTYIGDTLELINKSDIDDYKKKAYVYIVCQICRNIIGYSQKKYWINDDDFLKYLNDVVDFTKDQESYRIKIYIIEQTFNAFTKKIENMNEEVIMSAKNAAEGAEAARKAEEAAARAAEGVGGKVAHEEAMNTELRNMKAEVETNALVLKK